MNAKTNKVTLMTTTKPAPKSDIDTRGTLIRKALADTFTGHDGTGDFTTTLSNEYLCKIEDKLRADNPKMPAGYGAVKNNTVVEGTFLSLIHDAVTEAEDADNGPVATSSISAAGIRSSAADVAAVLAADAEFNSTGDAVIDAERVRKQGPGRMAWHLDRLFIKRAPDGTVLTNAIDACGTAWQSNAAPWPIIGTKEGLDEKTQIMVPNPDLVKKAGGGYQSWYQEVLRGLPRGVALSQEKADYMLAGPKDGAPSGKYADMTSDNYVDPVTARKLAMQCEDALSDFLKLIKRGVDVLRQMEKINAMSHNGAPPRTKATFAHTKVWNKTDKKWEEAKTLDMSDSVIQVRDDNGDSWRYTAGELMSIDVAKAGAAGGLVHNLRTSVGKKKPGAVGAGQGQTAPQVKVVLKNHEVMTFLTSLYSTLETPTSIDLFERTLRTGKPEETDDALSSAFRVAKILVHMFATNPELRTRVAKLENSTPESVDDFCGLGKETVKPQNPALIKAFAK